MDTAIHVTHEALLKKGGIGSVLEGLLNAEAYRKAISRTLLVGPMDESKDKDDPEATLSREGKVLYSGRRGVDHGGFAAILSPVEQRYNTRFVYGRRALKDKISDRTCHPEILLVDTQTVNPLRTGEFKYFLFERFGLPSRLYEHIEENEKFVKLASPAFDAVAGLLGMDEGPHHILAHEWMGMPFALKAILSEDRRFKTIFYAHETATVRQIVEESPGHDTLFYNIIDTALSHDIFLCDLFGPQDHYYKHAWVNRAHFCHKIFAVGDFVLKELKFLGPHLAGKTIDLVYNGIPGSPTPLKEKRRSKARLQRYAKSLLGYEPDLIFTHVSRLVKSKGFWRDIRALEHLDGLLRFEGKRAVMFLLSSAVGAPRSPEEVLKMEADYGWPLDHQRGWPDLEMEEIDMDAALRDFNRKAQAIRVILVNQIGWEQACCGRRMPPEMKFCDIRKGPDVEFGQSIYEPFGISQLEPLCSGGLCVPSNVCGCIGFVQKAAGGQPLKNVIMADYTTLPTGSRSLWEMLDIGLRERNEVETLNSMKVASMVFAFLPRNSEQEAALLTQGHEVSSRMTWEVVARDYFLPALERA